MTLRKSLLVLGLTVSAVTGTPAWASGDMSVATFLAKADSLKAKGLGAIGSPDIKLLYGEAQAAGAEYKAKIEADRKAGREPHSCPPSKAKMDSNAFLSHLRSYPAAVRPKTTITTAMFDVMKKRYPCP
ncbi:hypothetical protein [Sphingorhabdus sp.]|uniref:hypothetical protein n=1 Tax=Sphingorhabdus sp. TaxID=1902408 RepID=UPI0035B1FA36